MRKGIALSAVGVAAIAVVTAPVGAAAAVGGGGPGVFKIEIVSISGSGCTLDTTRVALGPEYLDFRIQYDDYTVQVGGSSKPADARKNCRLGMKITASPSFTYAISKTDYRTSPKLQSGAEAALKADYHFQGNPQNEKEFYLSGPVDVPIHFIDSVPTAQLVWKPCGEERNIEVSTELGADLGTSDRSKVSSVSVNTDGTISQAYRLDWKKCH